MVSFLGFRQDRDSVRDRQWRVQRSSGNRHICRYGVQPETLRGYDPAYGDLDLPAHIREVLKLNNRRDPRQEHLPAVRNHLQNNFLDPQLLVRQRLQTTSYQRHDEFYYTLNTVIISHEDGYMYIHATPNFENIDLFKLLSLGLEQAGLTIRDLFNNMLSKTESEDG